ncbi:MAG: phosphate ABC transporter ATP-binding protein [Bdellovibrionales bacterium]|nr:phosphate ABC transporter ATP-binding protein [Bdellovibrionales bacterium]
MLNSVELETLGLQAYFGQVRALHGVSLQVPRHELTALIGPSGCGKSTFIRCLNRLHEESPGARAEGKVLLEGRDIYAPTVDPVLIRRRIGMVFQRPNPFPAMTIYENVASGLILAGVRDRRVLDPVVERSLKQAALWDEVKDQLKKPGTRLSGGQQQRLCIARALAVDPPVLLMDEPTSALDPISTARIEELLVDLKKAVTVVMVTHNMQQAARVSDRTAFFLLGEMVESGRTDAIFTNPADSRTEQYITGRFG